MSLSEQLALEVPELDRCKVCRWAESLDEADAQAFRTHVVTNKPLSHLYRACKRLNPPLQGNYSTLSKHVRECLSKTS